MATYTYDPQATGAMASIYRLRLYMGDTNVDPMAAGLPAGRATALFSDQDYQAFMTAGNGDLIFAWYLALTAAAINADLASVDTQFTGGGSVSYGGRADRLTKQADTIYKLWCTLPAEAYAEQNTSPTAAERIIWNSFLRQWGS